MYPRLDTGVILSLDSDDDERDASRNNSSFDNTQESKSNHQQTTHSSSTSTANLWQQPQKKTLSLFTSYVLRYRHNEKSFRIRKCLHHRKRPCHSIKKRASGNHEWGRNWKEGDAVLSSSVTVLNKQSLLRSKKHIFTQHICVLKLATRIILQQVMLCLNFLIVPFWTSSRKVSSWWWQHKNKTMVQQIRHFDFDKASTRQRTGGPR